MLTRSEFINTCFSNPAFQGAMLQWYCDEYKALTAPDNYSLIQEVTMRGLVGEKGDFSALLTHSRVAHLTKETLTIYWDHVQGLYKDRLYRLKMYRPDYYHSILGIVLDPMPTLYSLESFEGGTLVGAFLTMSHPISVNKT